MMPGQSTHKSTADPEGASEPLLNGSQENLVASDSTIFAVDDDDDSDGGRGSSPKHGTPHTVRFEENVQIIGPPLRSTVQSREAGELPGRIFSVRRCIHLSWDRFLEFELDSDELEHDSDHPHTRGYNDQTMPLLVGLMDSSSARRSVDMPLPLNATGHTGSGAPVDLEELASKRISGGGMVDSIANMANSILGAGKRILVALLLCHLGPLIRAPPGIIGYFYHLVISPVLTRTVLPKVCLTP
jgi:sodium-coupled neutral amino acid transporter 11